MDRSVGGGDGGGGASVHHNSLWGGCGMALFFMW